MSQPSHETVAVSGRFAAYRVLELDSRYVDREEGQFYARSTEPAKDGSRYEVTLGALAHPMLYSRTYAVPLTDGQPAVRPSLEHRNLPEPVPNDDEATVRHPEFVKPDATYLTIGYVRPATVDGLLDRTIFWVAETQATRLRVEEFRAQALPAIDRACARLIASKPHRIVHAPVLPVTAYFEPDDMARQPVQPMRLEGSATVESSPREGWGDLDLDPLMSVFTEAQENHTLDPVVNTPTWWYLQAIDEKDPLRRFLFAHWGLEALAAKFAKTYRDKIADSLTEAYGIPAKALLWPTPESSDRPGRNAEFAFALMAWALKGDAAHKDIARFKRQADLRNKLSHGVRINHRDLPPHAHYELGQYLALVGNYAG